MRSKTKIHFVVTRTVDSVCIFAEYKKGKKPKFYRNQPFPNDWIEQQNKLHRFIRSTDYVR